MTFAVSGETYDRFVGRYSRLLAPRLADFAAIRPPARAVDVGCGPGPLTSELAARLGAASVAAADPSESLIGACRARVPGADVRVASAEALPWPDASFDDALSQLVVNFMADAKQGADELAALWRETGLRDVETAPLDVEVEYEDFDDYWLPFEGATGPAGAYLASLPASAQATLRAECFRLLGEPCGSFTLAARAWAVRGTV